MMDRAEQAGGGEAVVAAVDGATGAAVTENLAADAFGLTVRDDFRGQLVELAPEIGAMVFAAAPGDDDRAWRLGDAASLYASMYGDDWLSNIPRPEAPYDGRWPRPRTWQNLRTTAEAWAHRETRRHWHRRGLSVAHLAALNKLQHDAPDEAAEWAERAAVNDWTVAELRRALRGDPTPAEDDAADVALDKSLADGLAMKLRATFEAWGIDLLSDGQYLEAASSVLDFIDRHGRATADY
jgi:hypothetical protein